MGEWSEYFEDFPEENPANYMNGIFNPQEAQRQRAQAAKLKQEQAALDEEINAIIKGKKNTTTPSEETLED